MNAASPLPLAGEFDALEFCSVERWFLGEFASLRIG
jgi:hypothetical protein